MDREPKYWIVIAAKDHVMRGVAGGFMQANHGKEAPLKRMKPDDWVLFYSPKQALETEEKCQAFTAVGQVKEGAIYQVVVAEDFAPFRRSVTFYPVKEASILPLINDLEFIPNKRSWGYAFRFGLLFELIHRNMVCNRS